VTSENNKEHGIEPSNKTRDVLKTPFKVDNKYEFDFNKIYTQWPEILMGREEYWCWSGGGSSV
jgi:hypothetical protein